MKIILLTEFFPSDIGESFTGGVETRVYHLYQHLKRNNEVEVWSITSGYAFNSFKTFCKRVYFFSRQLIKIAFYRQKIDIVEGTNATTYLLAYLLARKTGAKSVAWFPDLLGWSGIKHVGFLTGITIALLERLSVKLNWDGIIALSEETKRKLIQAGVKGENVKVIYGGVKENLKFKMQSFDRAQDLRNSKLQRYKQPTIICISRLVRYKRIGDLILAIYLLKEKFPNIKLLIIGEGPEKENLKFEIRNLKLDKQIEMLGRIFEEDKWKYLSKSWVGVLPSIVEGFGLATVEALSVGTPVVNAEIPINREALEGEKGGLLFEREDYVDLADKIEELLSNERLYNQKVKEGKELSEQYDWEKVNEETKRFYEAVIAKE